MAESVRYCPNCKLVYRPDARVYKDPDTFCPQCGNRLIKEDYQEREDS